VTSVEIISDRIAVRPDYADLMICPRLGGQWNPALRAWTFPATPEEARAIRTTLRAAVVRTTAEFEVLISGAQPIRTCEPTTVSEDAGRQISGEVVVPAPAPEAPKIEPAPPMVLDVPKPQVLVPEPDVAIPDGILSDPWQHQRAALKFSIDRIADGRHGLLLAMGMGTGKSLVACMLMLALNARRVLIACPLRVIQVWVGQFQKHVGVPLLIVPLDDEVGTVKEKQELAAEKMRLAETLQRPYIAVINYDSVWREPFSTWAGRKIWDLFIADELHRAKSPSSKVSHGLKRLSSHARYRVGLTGTPMPHSPMDIYAQFRFLDIRIFGPAFTAFRAQYAEMGGYRNRQIVRYKNLTELEGLMSLITFRVGGEVLDLPPATDVTYYCEIAGEALEIYKRFENELIAEVRGETITIPNAMVLVTRLQQLTGGCLPSGDGDGHRIDSGKQKLLADVLEDIQAAAIQDGEVTRGTEPVVIFGRFTADLRTVHETCASLGLTSLEISGKCDELKRWQDGEADVLVVQIESGAEGVDFTRARYSNFYSIGYRLDKYEQAKKRTHRPGQNRPVTHIHLAAKNTIDVRVMRALEKRADVIESILAEINN
jgi:SNF2 family DNA or RNA helicase